MTAVAMACWTVKVASASRARISRSDCVGGSTARKGQRAKEKQDDKDDRQSLVGSGRVGCNGAERTSSKHSGG